MSFEFKYILIVIAPLVLICIEVQAQENDQILSKNNLLKLEKRKEVELKENEVFFKNITDIEALSSDKFVAIDRGTPKIVMYDIRGEQIQVIGREGSGPFEFQQPSLVAVNQGSFYIRDGRGFRLYAFSNSGIGKWQKVVIPLAFDTFYISGDTLLVQHQARYKMDSNSTLTAFNLNTQEKLASFGFKTMKDRLLSIYNGSGGLAKYKDRYYFAQPSRPVLYFIDRKLNRIDSLIINDEHFKVDDTGLTTSSPFPEIIEYITSNSRVAGIFSLNDYLVVQTEHGVTEVDDETRFSKLFVYDEYHQLIDTFVFTHSQWKNIGERVKFSYDNQIYYISEAKNQPIPRILSEWRMSKNM